MTAIKRYLTGFVHGREDARVVALFRIIFGALMFVLVARYFAHGWIDAYFIRPEFHFKYYGFAWVRPWPPAGMYVHFALMGALALNVMAGLFYRFSIIAFTVLFSYFFLLDVTIYLNHYYLVCLLSLLMCFIPAHGAWSLDAVRKPALRAERIPGLALNVLRLQFCIVYFFGGIAKLNGDWLLAAQPLRIWLAGRTDLFLIGPALAVPATAYLFAWAGMLFDLIVPFALWNRRARRPAFVVLIVFHLLTRLLFPIGMFPWLMIGGAVLFVSGDWFARRGGTTEQATDANGHVHGANRPLKWFLTLCVLLQVLIPLRFVLYPGDIRWREEGFRFAWRVMVMQKSGLAEFTAAGRALDPSAHLTPFQIQQMSTQPDLILQFAHYLGKKYGGPVHARVRVSVNGRPNRPLIDTETNLLGERDGFRAKPWIRAHPKIERLRKNGDRVQRGSADVERAGLVRRPERRSAGGR